MTVGYTAGTVTVAGRRLPAVLHRDGRIKYQTWHGHLWLDADPITAATFAAGVE